jgi:hypothetical protein
VVLIIVYILSTYSGHIFKDFYSIHLNVLFIFYQNINVTFLFNSLTQEEGTSRRFISSASKGGHADQVSINYDNKIAV